MRRFYLGAPQASFLDCEELADVPLTISRRTLARRKRQRRRLQGLWSLDSGAFTELSMHGEWTVTLTDFVDQVDRITAGIGSDPEWVGPRDWMCETPILAKTGRTVLAHQRLTLEDYLGLRDAAPHVPWLPVLQGWTLDDYLRHVGMYQRAGVRLEALPLVGVGSICRRQNVKEIASLLRELGPTGAGLRLHGFGVKLTGLANAADHLETADSMSWSYHARMLSYRMGYRSWCGTDRHDDCSTCPPFARYWYDDVAQRFGLKKG